MIFGVGEAAKDYRNEMEDLAGKKGHVVLLDSFQDLADRIVKEFKNKSCGKLKNNPYCNALLITGC